MEMAIYTQEVSPLLFLSKLPVFCSLLKIGFGLASHLGVLTGIPTIGIGKTFLFVDGLNVKDVSTN